jgi:hypothetical protein
MINAYTTQTGVLLVRNEFGIRSAHKPRVKSSTELGNDPDCYAGTMIDAINSNTPANQRNSKNTPYSSYTND